MDFSCRSPEERIAGLRADVASLSAQLAALRARDFEPEPGDRRECVYVKCESCGGSQWTDLDPQDWKCHGCGLVVCGTCCDVFAHVENEQHGKGDPAKEIKRLRAALSAARAEIESLQRRLDAFGSEPSAWQVVSALGVPVDVRNGSASAHFHMDRLNERIIDGRPYTVRPLYMGPA